MNIALLGYDTEGTASFDYLAGQGHTLTICDQNTNLKIPDDVSAVLGEEYLNDLNRFDLIIRTAGLPPRKIFDVNPELDPAKVSSHINEFLEACPTKNIIGVTGTKGKGTTSTLITRMLEAAGKQVFLGGNIGVPPLTFLSDITSDSWVVLELSSFQLIDLKTSPSTAVCLMVVPEHLNWHADFNEYTTAKAQLFAHQKTEDIAIYYANNESSEWIASHSAGKKIPYYMPPGATVSDDQIYIEGQAVCATRELRLLGGHNVQNACAAITAVWQATKDIGAMRSVLTTFSGLEHRLEFVREIEGVSYYDDSFGTTPETAIVAIEAFDEPKIVILGGSDKGASYDDLARAVVENNVKQVLLIGDQATRIQAALDSIEFSNYTAGGDTMPAIVANATAAAKPGDIVLLSTGCASFGMFANYKDRGNQFTQAVQALA